MGTITARGDALMPANGVDPRAAWGYLVGVAEQEAKDGDDGLLRAMEEAVHRTTPRQQAV